MDFKQIQELIKIINKSNIGEISVEEKDFKITIRQKEDAAPVSAAPAPITYYAAQQHAPDAGRPVIVVACNRAAYHSANNGNKTCR